MAIAHSILKIVYHILITKQPFQDLGHNYHLERKKEHETNRAVKRLEKLGYKVEISELTA